MAAAHESNVYSGWRLDLALPVTLAGVSRELADFAVATAGGGVVAPMRRSRHALTFQAQFAAGGAPPVNLFVKVLAPPGGFNRFKRLLRGSAARHVVRVTGQLTAAGLRAPPVWLHGRESATRRELLVTPRAAGDGPLRTLAALHGAVATRRAIFRALGSEIAHLHRSGFVHGDLTPFNIFILRGEPPHFILLDHERTRRSFFLGRARRQLRNLVQLGRFSLPGVSRTDRMRVLRAYAATLYPHDSRRVVRRVNTMLARRLQHDRGLPNVRPSRVMD